MCILPEYEQKKLTMKNCRNVFSNEFLMETIKSLASVDFHDCREWIGRWTQQVGKEETNVAEQNGLGTGPKTSLMWLTGHHIAPTSTTCLTTNKCSSIYYCIYCSAYASIYTKVVLPKQATKLPAADAFPGCLYKCLAFFTITLNNLLLPAFGRISKRATHPITCNIWVAVVLRWVYCDDIWMDPLPGS